MATSGPPVAVVTDQRLRSIEVVKVARRPRRPICTVAWSTPPAPSPTSVTRDQAIAPSSAGRATGIVGSADGGVAGPVGVVDDDATVDALGVAGGCDPQPATSRMQARIAARNRSIPSPLVADRCTRAGFARPLTSGRARCHASRA